MGRKKSMVSVTAHKVFMYILSKNNVGSKAAEIVEGMGMSRSHVYNCLNYLINKNYIERIKKGKYHICYKATTDGIEHYNLLKLESENREADLEAIHKVSRFSQDNRRRY